MKLLLVLVIGGSVAFAFYIGFSSFSEVLNRKAAHIIYEERHGRSPGWQAEVPIYDEIVRRQRMEKLVLLGIDAVICSVAVLCLRRRIRTQKQPCEVLGKRAA